MVERCSPYPLPGLPCLGRPTSVGRPFFIESAAKPDARAAPTGGARHPAVRREARGTGSRRDLPRLIVAFDEFRQRHADLVALGDDDVTARDENVVGVDFDRLAGLLFKLDHRATTEFQKLVDAQVGLAEHHGNLHRHAVDGLFLGGGFGLAGHGRGLSGRRRGMASGAAGHRDRSPCHHTDTPKRLTPPYRPARLPIHGGGREGAESPTIEATRALLLQTEPGELLVELGHLAARVDQALHTRPGRMAFRVDVQSDGIALVRGASLELASVRHDDGDFMITGVNIGFHQGSPAQEAALILGRRPRCKPRLRTESRVHGRPPVGRRRRGWGAENAC